MDYVTAEMDTNLSEEAHYAAVHAFWNLVIAILHPLSGYAVQRSAEQEFISVEFKSRPLYRFPPITHGWIQSSHK